VPRELEVLQDAIEVAGRAAQLIAEAARDAVHTRGRFTLALSGGRTPSAMLRALADEDLPWAGVRIVQVDERVAPEGHPDRNLTALEENLLSRAPLAREQVFAMPVGEQDLAAAARDYARTLVGLAGRPPRLDLVQLGLGNDGHTASLVPEDPALDVVDEDVAVTAPYQGRVRMTLTYPVLNQARHVLWIVTGSEKAEMLRRLQAGDATIPAARVHPKSSTLLADAASAR
jgi:6-phosphogluconolactonase